MLIIRSCFKTHPGTEYYSLLQMLRYLSAFNIHVAYYLTLAKKNH